MVRPASYGRLILRADPDFVEVKGYVHVGESRRRLPREAMPSMEEIEAFAKEIAESSSYRRRDSFGPSKVVLLSRK
jgi:tRNA wybutosine-synthesizing protein 1